MRKKLTTALLVTTVAVGLIGGGVALGASTHHAVKACSKKSNHVLGLLKSGKCPKGYTHVTLGAQGPQGKRGPAGPGAIYDTLTGGNNDEQVVFPETVAGMTIETNCGLAANVSITVAPSGGTGTIDASGTESADGVVAPVDDFNAPGVANAATNRADIDIVASVNGGPFAHFDIHGTWANSACHYWMVAIPASQASHT